MSKLLVTLPSGRERSHTEISLCYTEAEVCFQDDQEVEDGHVQTFSEVLQETTSGKLKSSVIFAFHEQSY